MLTVCNYHYIRENFKTDYPSIFGITPAQFKKQLEALRDFGEFIHPNLFLSNSEEILKSKKNYILVTFDDGLKEQFLLANPILESLDISALFFINTANVFDEDVSLVHKIHIVRSEISPEVLLDSLNLYVDNSHRLNLQDKKNAEKTYIYDTLDNAHLKYLLNFKLPHNLSSSFISKIFSENFEENSILSELYMNEEQLKKLGEKGLLGSHSHNHSLLGKLGKQKIISELSISKNLLEKFTTSQIEFVSYPYGNEESCASPVPEIAKEIGYKMGFTTKRGFNTSNENKLLLNRFDTNDLPTGKNPEIFQKFYNAL